MLKWIVVLPGYGSPLSPPLQIQVMESVTVYNPQRVLRKFEYDQGTVRFQGDTL